MSHSLNTLRKSASYLGLAAALTAILPVAAFAAEVSSVRLKAPETSLINFPPTESGASLWLNWPAINASINQPTFSPWFVGRWNELLPLLREKQPCRSTVCRPADPFIADRSTS